MELNLKKNFAQAMPIALRRSFKIVRITINVEAKIIH